MKFSYAKNIESDEPIMLINKHIGMDDEDGMGIDGSLFQEELLALDSMGKKRIQIWINSVGGSVMDGYNICNAILKSNTRVDTYCLGMAASIAGVIFQTGRKRIMADYGILMYHNPYSGDQTSSPVLDQMKESLNRIISQKSGMNSDAVHRMMDRTTFIGAQEAMTMGLTDEVENTVKLNTKNFPKNDTKYYWKEANKVLNKVFDLNNIKMTKVTNKLKLTAEANEESIVDAITQIENRATAAETALAAKNKASQEELDKMKNDLQEAEDKFTKMKNDYDKACNELEEMNKAKTEAENKAKAEKAKNLVETYAKAGIIKNEPAEVNAWIADATADFAKVEARLKGLPVNKSAVKFELKTGNEPVKYSSVALDMAKISNKFTK